MICVLLAPFKTDFGAFYPTGYIIAAFEKYDDAQQVCQDLLTGGYEERDCTLHVAEEVAEGASSIMAASPWMRPSCSSLRSASCP